MPWESSTVFQHPCFHNPGVRICWCSTVCTVMNIGWILSFFIFLLSDSNLHFYHVMTLVCTGPILLLKLKWLTKLAIPKVCLYHICCIGFLKVDLVRTQCWSQGLYLRDTHGDGVMWSYPHCLTWYSASVSLFHVYLFRSLLTLGPQHFKKVPSLWGITRKELCSHLPCTPCESFLDLGQW